MMRFVCSICSFFRGLAMPKPLQRVPVFQLLLTCEQFKAIGHIAVQWAFLESEINREIVWLLCAQSTKASVLFSIQVLYQNHSLA
jgi:hypothetical protein